MFLSVHPLTHHPCLKVVLMMSEVVVMMSEWICFNVLHIDYVVLSRKRDRFFPKENKSRIDTTSDVGETPTNLFYFIPSFVHSATASIVGSLKAYGAEAVCS